MDDQLVFVDVETPNRRNDRICSIGTIRTDLRGNVLNESNYLVDPEEDFDSLNIGIHGIHPEMVTGCYNFADLWRAGLADDLSNGIIVAHNAASADLPVLKKCLDAYCIEYSPVRYTCTMRLAGRYLPGLSNYQLPTVCDALGISAFKHHDAMDDARACESVFFTLENRYSLLDDAKNLHIYPIPTPAHSEFKPKLSESTKDLGVFIDIVRFVLSDGHVSVDEAQQLIAWIDSHQEIASDGLVSSSYGLLLSAMEDGTLSPAEESELMHEFKRIVDPADMSSDKKIEYDDRGFYLSGDFKYGTKDDVGAVIESRGGRIEGSVTKKRCNYVVIGGRGSDAYAYGNYGTNAKKALKFREEGAPIDVVKESDLGLPDRA